MCLVFLSLVLAMTPTVRDRHGHAVGIHLSPSLAPWHGSDRQKEVGGRPLDMVHVGTGKRGRQGAGVLRGFPPSLPGGPKYLSRSTVSTPNFPAVKKHPLDYIVTPFSGKRTRYMAATCPKLGSCPDRPATGVGARRRCLLLAPPSQYGTRQTRRTRQPISTLPPRKLSSRPGGCARDRHR